MTILFYLRMLPKGCAYARAGTQSVVRNPDPYRSIYGVPRRSRTRKDHEEAILTM
jgi:hypothetical protein